MMSINDAVAIAQDKMQLGIMSCDQANVFIVQLMGVQIVNKLPRAVRNALNKAVKNGELGHIKKDGLRPEAYFHVNSRSNALDMRNKIAYESAITLKKVLCNG